MKRFYREVSVAAVAGAFEVRLDGRGVRTPAKAAFVVPGLELAEAIAAEWRAQGTDILPASMPMMQLASTALDITGRKRQDVIDQLAAYAGTDLVCYRVDHPAELVAREARVWQPLLEWAALRFDAVLQVGSGIMPRPQPEGACRALRGAVASLDDWRLTALQLAVCASGSLVIGLALLEGRLDAAGAFEASQLHETHQLERWGEDPETTRRREGLRADLTAAHRFLWLLTGSKGPAALGGTRGSAPH